jgi:hypothetical protein
LVMSAHSKVLRPQKPNANTVAPVADQITRARRRMAPREVSSSSSQLASIIAAGLSWAGACGAASRQA